MEPHLYMRAETKLNAKNYIPSKSFENNNRVPNEPTNREITSDKDLNDVDDTNADVVFLQEEDLIAKWIASGRSAQDYNEREALLSLMDDDDDDDFAFDDNKSFRDTSVKLNSQSNITSGNSDQ